MVGDRHVAFAAVPPQAALFVQLIERVGPRSVDYRKPRQSIDQPELLQFDKGFAERAGVAEISAGDDDPIGHFPPQCFQHAEHDRLLPFETERINAVDQVQAQIAAHFLHAGHRVVKIAGDLNRQRAVVEGLRELAVADLARADEDDGLHQSRGGAVHGQRRAGVAGRGAGRPLGADGPGVRERGRHAVVFE